MNKFSILIASLMVVAVAAQLVACEDAKEEGLVSELEDDVEVDGELEGGPGGSFFRSQKQHETKAARPVGVTVLSQWSKDIQTNGQATFAEDRKADCADASTKKACTACCNDLQKSAEFVGRLQNVGRTKCTCYTRDNNYSARP